MGFEETVIEETVIEGMVQEGPRKFEMHIANSDFWTLAGILSTIGGIGIYEGYELSPLFHSQTAIIFGGLGYLAFKTFYVDREAKQEYDPSVVQK